VIAEHHKNKFIACLPGRRKAHPKD
jgi:hypothetical protein